MLKKKTEDNDSLKVLEINVDMCKFFFILSMFIFKVVLHSFITCYTKFLIFAEIRNAPNVSLYRYVKDLLHSIQAIDIFLMSVMTINKKYFIN